MAAKDERTVSKTEAGASFVKLLSRGEETTITLRRTLSNGLKAGVASRNIPPL
jgi:hypothetical protein